MFGSGRQPKKKEYVGGVGAGEERWGREGERELVQVVSGLGERGGEERGEREVMQGSLKCARREHCMQERQGGK